MKSKKGFTSFDKKAFTALGILALAGYYYTFKELASTRNEQLSDPNRLYLNNGCLVDTNSPSDGIPDYRIVTTYLPAAPGIIQKKYPCTQEEIQLFQEDRR
jgi:hypothetical protein